MTASTINISTNAIKTTIIDVLRHGEPEGGKMYRGGGTNHSLSKNGWDQMLKRIHDLGLNEANTWEAIVSSPMNRCKEFAEYLAEKQRVPLSSIEGFREASYGDWEGRTPEEIMKKSEKEYWGFFDDPVNCRPAQSEPLEVFTPRIQVAFSDLLKDFEGKHILLVVHLGVTRAIIGDILSMPLASQQLIDMPFAGMIRIINDRKGLRLVLF